MRVDNRGHHRLAREVDAPSARRRLDRGAWPHLRDFAAVNDERRVLDRLAVADDQARTFEHGGAC
jgi:hypothetical protein